MADYKVAGADLVSVADAIRTKGGTSDQLVFPDGFVDAIGDIPTGQPPVLVTKNITANGTYQASSDNADGYSSVTVNIADLNREAGTFTCPDSGSSYEFQFSKTYSKYMILIEATDETKQAIIASGQTAGRTFAVLGFYPKLSINNSTNDNTALLNSYNPSTGAMGGMYASNFDFTSTSVTVPLSSMGSAYYLYRGYTYKYSITEML